MEPRALHFRLSLMMFGLYLVLGSWAVTLATYLISSPLVGGLSFTASQVGWIYNTWAFGGLTAPVFLGLLADRLFPVQRLLAFFSILSGLILFIVASFLSTQQDRIEQTYRTIAEDMVIANAPLTDQAATRT
jgi:MFS family permease